MRRLYHPASLGVLMFAGGSAMMTAQMAQAAPALSITAASILPNGTGGSFDVLLSNPAGTQHIGAYNAAFVVSPESGASGGITFAPPTTATTNPLFPAQVPSSDISGGKVIGGTDSDNSSPFFIVGGDNTRLFHETFTFNPGSIGTFDINFLTTGPFTTSLTDASTSGPVAGLTETGAAFASPEPGGMTLFVLSGLPLMLRRSKRA